VLFALLAFVILAGSNLPSESIPGQRAYYNPGDDLYRVNIYRTYSNSYCHLPTTSFAIAPGIVGQAELPDLYNLVVHNINVPLLGRQQHVTY
jgi:hypothetical protein